MDNYVISYEFEFWQDPTFGYEMNCSWAYEETPIDLKLEKCCSHSSDFILKARVGLNFSQIPQLTTALTSQ